jgi:hypothetical protein
MSLFSNSPKIWDLRTGGIAETLRYDYPVSSLQFDSRKVVSCTGENGVKVGQIYNCWMAEVNALIDVQPDNDATLYPHHEWTHSAGGKSEVHGPLLNKRSTRRHSQNLVNITEKRDLEPYN